MRYTTGVRLAGQSRTSVFSEHTLLHTAQEGCPKQSEMAENEKEGRSGRTFLVPSHSFSGVLHMKLQYCSFMWRCFRGANRAPLLSYDGQGADRAHRRQRYNIDACRALCTHLPQENDGKWGEMGECVRIARWAAGRGEHGMVRGEQCDGSALGA